MAFRKENKIKSNFSKITIGLASPEEILENSSGEVLKPETINYRTYKPERDGLFCERIFGPIKDYECHCGKYKRIRYKGIVCDRCGVEVTEKKVRRERMGHIHLVVPVAHIWYFRSLPNKIGYLLGLPTKKLDSIIYYERYVVIQPGCVDTVGELDLLSEEEYLDILDSLPRENQLLEDTDPNKFIAKIGAEAVYDLLARLDLDSLSYELRHRANTDTSQQRKNEALKRLQVVESFRASRGRNKPEWMIMKVIPVIPPELRPLVPLDGGRFATSDLNDLYRRVIIRNNRLKRLIDIKAPEVILRNEKRMLQEAVDSLFDNSRKSSAVKTDANRPLKSLSDSLKGKQGRFRQNLLGKRVDYSARSVIVVGPELKMHECGLPKNMAAELYKPFVIRKLIERGIVKTVKSAKKIVDRKEPVVWDILEYVMKGHPVLLNRAPTLHRLGIQAFQPKLIEGKAIQLHPLACTAFNADFDGDQMAIHVPLSAEAQAEARILMLSANNLLRPQDGGPVTVPTQDMVLGSYYLTMDRMGKDEIGAQTVWCEDAGDTNLTAQSIVDADEFLAANAALEKGQKPATFKPVHMYASEDEALMAYNDRAIGPHCPILVRRTLEVNGESVTRVVPSTPGRIIFNKNIPQDLGFVDRSDPEHICDYEITFTCGKKQLGQIVDRTINKHGFTVASEVLDAIKSTGYHNSTIAAITVSIADMTIPPKKYELVAASEQMVVDIENQYKMGFMTDHERYKQVVQVWEKTTDEVSTALQENLDRYNPIFMMADSGARGSMKQIRQLAGMRGLIANTAGKTIEIPIKANYREGLTALEYFISSRGARKGLADTALRTADSGYLTRRMVDVSQDVIIREQDCGVTHGIKVSRISENGQVIEKFSDRVRGRYLVGDVVDAETGEVLIPNTKMMMEDDAKLMETRAWVQKNPRQGDECSFDPAKDEYPTVMIRTVLTCKAHSGVCAKCYGMNLATQQPVGPGEAVGIIAAQSIGEPGTQLTMRTFHTGGLAGGDITQGLPRVEELFEARRPKRMATIAEIGGTVRFEEAAKGSLMNLIVTASDGETCTYAVPHTGLLVKDGEVIEKGTQLTYGALNPHEVLRIRGNDAVYNYLIQEVLRVYRQQGVDINDKHIEVIVRQMMRKVRIEDAGDTKLLDGSMTNVLKFEAANEEIDRRNAAGETNEMGEPLRKAQATQLLMGITKASLATDSFLSAASFQETTKVLTEAAIMGKKDHLVGLKENVLIGKLIPAGTGLQAYRTFAEELVPAETVQEKEATLEEI